MLKKTLILIVALTALTLVAYPLLARSFRAGYGPGGGQGRYIGSPARNYYGGACQGYGGSSWMGRMFQGKGRSMNRYHRGMGPGWQQRRYPSPDTPYQGYPDGRDWSNQDRMGPVN